VQWTIAEISYQQALVAGGIPHELNAVQMDQFAAQRNLTVDQQIRVAEVGAEYGVVVLSHRTQQQGPRFFEQQLKLRQNAGVVVIKTFGVPQFAADVAPLIEHGEGVAVLQGSSSPFLQRGAYGNGVLRGRNGVVDRLIRFRVDQRGYIHAGPTSVAVFVKFAARLLQRARATNPSS